MAVVSKNPTYSIFSLKNLLLSISAVFMAFLLKLYVPFAFEVFVSAVPALRSWFTPPYLYVVVNFIIIAIAASSRFQQKMEERVSEMVASAKAHHTHVHKETYDVAGRKNSVEYKADFGGMQPEMYGHFEVNRKQSTLLEAVETKKKTVESMEAKYLEANMKGNSVEPNKEVVVLKPKKCENSEAKNLQVNSKTEVNLGTKEVVVLKPRRYENYEAKNSDVNYKMETTAKEAEDEYSHAKSEKMPNPMSTIEIPMDYSSDERKASARSDYQEPDEQITLQAGKEVRAAGEEENDTLEGTWKMIMESRRIHEAALQQQQASEARSPSHSREKQDIYNY